MQKSIYFKTLRTLQFSKFLFVISCLQFLFLNFSYSMEKQQPYKTQAPQSPQISQNTINQQALLKTCPVLNDKEFTSKNIKVAKVSNKIKIYSKIGAAPSRLAKEPELFQHAFYDVILFYQDQLGIHIDLDFFIYDLGNLIENYEKFDAIHCASLQSKNEFRIIFNSSVLDTEESLKKFLAHELLHHIYATKNIKHPVWVEELFAIAIEQHFLSQISNKTLNYHLQHSPWLSLDAKFPNEKVASMFAFSYYSQLNLLALFLSSRLDENYLRDALLISSEGKDEQYIFNELCKSQKRNCNFHSLLKEFLILKYINRYNYASESDIDIEKYLIFESDITTNLKIPKQHFCGIGSRRISKNEISQLNPEFIYWVPHPDSISVQYYSHKQIPENLKNVYLPIYIDWNCKK